jgi:hypothetical protein
MKKIFVSLFIASAITAYSQVQSQGEYHKFIVKKTDDERRKTKSKEWWGAGVIMFSKQDIPREGKTAQVQPMLQSSFKGTDKFVGRVYLPKAVGQMDAAAPDAITYRVYVDNVSRPYLVEVSKENMPEKEWSSWLIDFPDNFEAAMNSIEPGTHKIRVEIWSSREVEKTTVYTDENDKAVAVTKENDNKGKFWAAGEFTLTK